MQHMFTWLEHHWRSVVLILGAAIACFAVYRKRHLLLQKDDGSS